MICAAYEEKATSHVKDGIKNFAKEISVLKMNRVLDAASVASKCRCADVCGDSADVIQIDDMIIIQLKDD